MTNPHTTAERLTALQVRIANYLAHGGLFNPESMQHDNIRALLLDLREALADLLAAAPQAEPCVIRQYCLKHDFIHGAEAEELRERVETILDQVDHEGADAANTLDCALRVMLDEVDARDSAAFSRVEGAIITAGLSSSSLRAKVEALKRPIPNDVGGRAWEGYATERAYNAALRAVLAMFDAAPR